ncbi:Bax inhibitor-1/YccA family protein [Carboxylicivirga mesophila]|uniref:Bax inhibitor-1/YccA family protein n=1 Tax=Carboxylicivirga mesophila TaxID=1166478 RepID=A0ABS5KEV9_9BACT|nr:Bax inhibitor-1/YccA family protein [Carboxylicivirga mesophila]MBS2213594.1 Bax inhibitor-1/YccA family protein [Carboxylicivirga mesophila]
MKQSISFTQEAAIAAEQQRFMTKVYGWMSFALIITGLVAMWTASTPQLINLIFSNQFVFIGIIVLEFILVARLVSVIKSISAQMATMLFILYAFLNGITLSAIFIVFTEASIATTFYVTAGTFGIMSLYGYFTKSDLSRFGNLFFMALIGLILASVVNMFLHNEQLYWITTYVGVLLFVGLTAYDTQKIKKMNIIGNEGTEEDKKEAIIGALTLYLDFINLFLYLLRIFGKRK